MTLGERLQDLLREEDQRRHPEMRMFTDGLPKTDLELSQKQFAKEMSEAYRRAVSDAEAGHIEADRVMGNLLRELGYTEGVDYFERMKKWYS